MQQLDSQKVNVELAQKLIDLSLFRFQYHQATIVELTQAQQSFQQAAYALTNLSLCGKIFRNRIETVNQPNTILRVHAIRLRF